MVTIFYQQYAQCPVVSHGVFSNITYLLDGTQGESVSVSCDDKLKIASKLSTFNVDYIEAGWPGSNPKDAEFFSRAKTELSPLTRSKLVAFGSTRRKNIAARDDPQIQKLVESGAGTICMVAKGHLWQVKEILCAEPEENLKMIEDSVSYLVNLGKTVFVDLEHFFDGYKLYKEYSLKCCKAAVDAGASGLVLCDTNGGSMPWEVGSITADIVNEFANVTVGIHAHNDCGMAVANSVIAAKNGAGLVQGTINGIGERTGNADLCSIIPTLALHVGSKVSCMDNLHNITSLSRFVDETMNRQPNSAAPFVGASAFAHKGGLHVAAMERSPKSYQHIDPSLVGNEKRVLISELSGRQNIMGKVKILGGYDDNLISDKVASERALAILNRVKHLESIGYTFEGAEASVDIMILHATKGYCRPFTVLDYAAQVFETNLDPELRNLSFDPRKDDRKHKYGATARATVTVRTIDILETVSNNILIFYLIIISHDLCSTLSQSYYLQSDSGDTGALPYTDRLEVSDGNGPVDALAGALKRALVPSHPSLANLELIDYKVRILDPESATAAATRVMIEFREKETERTWTTVSVDRNVISASLNALVDGFEYALIEHASACALCDDFFD
jgi:2-isopropylmalate synthase